MSIFCNQSRCSVWVRLAIAGCLPVLLSNCISTRARLNDINSRAANSSVVTGTPVWQKQKSWFAKNTFWMVGLPSTAAGWQTGMDVENETTKEVTRSKPLGAAVYGLLGFAFGYTIGSWKETVAKNEGRTLYTTSGVAYDERYRWLSRYNKNQKTPYGLAAWNARNSATLVLASTYWNYVLGQQTNVSPFARLNLYDLTFLNNNRAELPDEPRLRAMLARSLSAYRLVEYKVNDSETPVLLVRADANPARIVCTNQSMLNWFALAFPTADPDGMIRASVSDWGDNELAYILRRYSKSTASVEVAAPLFIKRASSRTDAFARFDKAVSWVDKPLHPSVHEILADKVSNVDGALEFVRRFPSDGALQSGIINRLSGLTDRAELLQLIRAFPKAEQVTDIKKRYIKLASTYTTFTEALRTFPELGYPDPAHIATDEAAARTVDAWLAKPDYSVIEPNTATLYRQELQTNFYTARIQTIQNNREALEKLEDTVANADWLLTESKTTINASIAEHLSNFRWKDAMAEARQSMGDGAAFAMMAVAPDHPLTQTLKPELERLTKQYVKIEQADIWTAMGNHSWMDGLVEQLDGVKTGGQYNIFVGGFLRNTLPHPIRVEITSTLNYYNTTNISFLSSTQSRTKVEKYYAEVPPESRIPFVVVYKDFRTGGRIGSGLLSAGNVSTLNETTPYSVNLKYFMGNLPADAVQQQEALFNVLRRNNNGNIDINDSAEKKVQRDQERIASKLKREEERKEEEAEEQREQQEEKTAEERADMQNQLDELNQKVEFQKQKEVEMDKAQSIHNQKDIVASSCDYELINEKKVSSAGQYDIYTLRCKTSSNQHKYEVWLKKETSAWWPIGSKKTYEKTTEMVEYMCDCKK